MILIVLALLCTPAFGQKTAIDWVNEGHHLKAQGKYDEAIQAYDKAIEIDPQEKIAWNEKANALKALGRNIEADATSAKINELEAAGTVNILDHSMAGSVDESTQSVIGRTHEFSVNDSTAYSWLSLGNVPEASTVWWYWFSPAGDMLYTDKVRIPLTSGAPAADDMLPTSGALWLTYNLSSHMDIAGNAAANLPGDWHVEVHLNGAKILTDYFSISRGQTLTAEENQEYNPGKSNEAIYKDYNQGRYEMTGYENINNQSKYDEAMRKGDNLMAEGRYDEAINFYERAIDLETNDFHNYWKALNSKGGALSKQGRYAEAIQAYDKAIELIPDNPMVWASKGDALKALGRTNESNFAYATARALGDNSAGIPETNVSGLNLTSLYHVEILDHSMASNVDESTNEVITKTNKFSSTDSKIYSWMNLGHVLGAAVEWHWYSPDGNPYKTEKFDIPRNPNGGYWSSYNVWDGLDIADIPAEPYLSGDWHVDIYIGNQKRLTEHFDLKTAGYGQKSGPRPEPTTLGTIKVLDHGMASMIDEATDMPVTTTKTTEFNNNIKAYSWLQLGDVGVARVEWQWNHPGQDTIIESFNIPPNPKGGYWPSYNLWYDLDIPNLVSLWRTGEAQAESRRSEEEREGHLPTTTNTIPDPYGDWTVDVYVNDQWLLQEQFTVVWSGLK